jgi:hypothetical protein
VDSSKPKKRIAVWKVALALYLGASLVGTIIASQINSSADLNKNEASQNFAQNPVDIVRVSTAWLQSEDSSQHTCNEFFVCIPVEITIDAPCSLVELRYDILDSETNSVLVRATAYARNPEVGKNVYEIGLNNYLSKPELLLFTLPVGDCLDLIPLPSPIGYGMYDLPSKFCDNSSADYCSASYLSGWQIQGIELQSWEGGDVPGGFPVLCRDGWISYSGGKQGACSSHGGVAD